MFCEWELKGYDEYVAIAKMPKSIQELRRAGSAEHRATEFYASFGIEVDIDYFGSGESAIKWMSANPDQFRPIKFLFPKPVGEIERNAHATANALLSTSMRAKDLYPEWKGPDAPVFCYASGDTFAGLLERIRTSLTAKILVLV